MPSCTRCSDRAMMELFRTAKVVAQAGTLASQITPEGHGVVAGALFHHLQEAIHAVDPTWYMPAVPAPLVQSRMPWIQIRKTSPVA